MLFRLGVFSQKFRWVAVCFTVAGAIFLTGGRSAYAQRKTADELREIREALVAPSQSGVDVDTLNEQEMQSATLLKEKTPEGFLYTLKSGGGLTIRTLRDTNNDNQLDQWGFYKNGVEIYRDIHSDRENQMRWLNTGGTRWGIDTNKDGAIDFWKVLSPEETSEEVVGALAARDVNRFMRVALTADELRAFQCGQEMTQKLSAAISQQQQSFQQALQAIPVSQNAQWGQFSALRPSTIPTGTNGSANDMTVYYDAVTVINDGETSVYIQLGSLVKIGDVWKAIEAPAPYNSGRTPTIAPSQTDEVSGAANDPLIREKTSQIEELEKQLNAAPAPQRAAIYDQIIVLRLEVANLFVSKYQDTVNRDKWLCDLADFIYAAVSIDAYPAGIKKLQDLSKGLQDIGINDAAAYMMYRAVEAEFFAAQTSSDTTPQSYTDRIVKLEQLVKDFPSTETAVQVQIVLIGEYELTNRAEDAKKTAQAIKTAHPNTAFAEKADGYIRRIDSFGKVFSFQGNSSTGSTINLNQYNGKIVVLYFWASWADPNGEVATELKKLQARYERDGLTIIGVNMDETADAMQEHVTKNATRWPNIHESGGQESRPAVYAGVNMPPFFMLINKEGKVVNNLLLLPKDVDHAVFNLIRGE